MPTVEETLLSSGWTAEEIKALDAKKLQGFSQIVSTANETLAKAELAQRAQAQTYENEIAPALDKWANDKAAYDTKIAAYDAALKSAKEGGFTVPPILENTPPPTTARTADGRFVTGANQVPGSPDFVKLKEDIGGAFSFAADTQWKYRTLYGREMPDSPTQIIREATAQRMNPVEYAAKKYDFAAKEAQIKADEAKKFEDKIRAEERDKVTKEWTEKTGSNPMVRQAEVSRFSQVAQAVKKGERKDTTLMNPEERRQYTREQIHKEMAANETVQ